MRKAKVVLVGAASVGKTCIAQRISRDVFNENSAPTVGAANMSVTIKTNSNNVIFNIWDTAGQERYKSLAPMYFAASQAAILVFDITSKESFDELGSFADMLRQRAPGDCALFVVGNKSDLENKRAVTEETGQSYATSIGAVFYTETSAATGKGIRELFNNIADCGLLSYQSDEIDYTTSFNTTEKKSGCC
jgi:small GTP-binding protein